jgi:hypothetical protein
MNEAYYFAAPIARRDDGAVVADEVVEAGCSKTVGRIRPTPHSGAVVKKVGAVVGGRRRLACSRHQRSLATPEQLATILTGPVRRSRRPSAWLPLPPLDNRNRCSYGG